MNTKTTVVLALVCAVVAAYMLLIAKPWAPEVQPEEPLAAGRPLVEAVPEGIDRVEFTRRREPTMTLVKTEADDDDSWMIESPLSAPANRWEVESLVNAVKEIEYVKEYASGAADRPSQELAGMDEPLATLKLYEGTSLKASLTVGASVPVGKGDYLKLGDSDKLLVSKDDVRRRFDKRVEQFRNKRVLRFDLKDVQRVKVSGVRNFELVRADGDEWMLESPTRSRVKKSEAESFIRPLTYLSAEEFKDDDPIALKPYGLKEPRLKVTVDTLKEIPPKAKPGDPDTQPADTQPSMAQETYVLMVGGATDPKGESFFARLDTAPWVFSIRKNTYDSLTPELTELREASIATVEPANVTKVEARTPEGKMAIAKNDEGRWVFADGVEADATLVQDLAKAVRDLEATEYVDPKSTLTVFDWDNPRARITLYEKGALNPVTVLVGPPTPSERLVYVRNLAEEAVAAVREEAVAQLLQPPVSYRTRTVMKFKRELAREVQITQRGRDPIRLGKSGRTWSMIEPVRAKADADAVRNLLQDLSALSAEYVAAIGDKAKFGLDEPEVRVRIELTAPADQPNAKVIGNVETPTQSAAMASLEDPAVDAPTPVEDRPVADSAGGQPAGTQPAGIKPVEGESELDREIRVLGELLEYQKTHPDQENPMATEMLKKRLAEKLAEREGTATQPAQGNAEAPALVQTAPADAAPQPEPIVLTLDLSRHEGKVYAAVPGKDTVYVLAERIYDDVTAEMHDRQLTRFDVENVLEIAFRTSAASLTLRKAGEEWKYAEDPVLPIDEDKVNDVLNAFKELRTHRFADYDAADLGAYGLGEDADRVIFTLAGGQTLELRLANQGPSAGQPGDEDDRYAMIVGSNAVFLLTGDQANKFGQKVEDFEASDEDEGAAAAPPPRGGMGGPQGHFPR